jgi:hypothetical protein
MAPKIFIKRLQIGFVICRTEPIGTHAGQEVLEIRWRKAPCKSWVSAGFGSQIKAKAGLTLRATPCGFPLVITMHPG